MIISFVICLFMFLPNVSANITVYKMDTPPDFNVYVDDSGIGNNTIPYGRYCFIGYWGCGSGYYGSATSPVTTQKCVVTTAENPTINIVVPQNPNKYGHFTFKWEYDANLFDENGVYYSWVSSTGTDITKGHRKWSTRYYKESSCPDNTTLTFDHLYTSISGSYCGMQDGAAEDSSAFFSKMGVDPIGWASEYVSSRSSPNINLESVGFDTNQGSVVIEISDFDYDWEDLKQAIKDSNAGKWFRLTNNSFVTRGLIIFSGGGGLTLENVNGEFLAGRWVGRGMTLNKSNMLFNGAWMWSDLQGDFYYSTVKINGNALILTNVGETNYFFPQHTAGSYGTYMTIYPGNNKTYYGYKAQNSGMQYRYTKTYSALVDCSFVNSMLSVTASVNNSVTDFNNVYFDNHLLSHDMYYDPAYIYNLETDQNQTINFNNLRTYNEDGLLDIKVLRKLESWANKPTITFNYNYNLEVYVKDKNENILANSTVTVIDVDGKVYKGYCDENGYVNMFITTNVGLFDTNYTYYPTNYNKSPFTIVVASPGYDSYVTKQSITKAQEWTITLPPYSGDIPHVDPDLNISGECFVPLNNCDDGYLINGAGFCDYNVVLPAGAERVYVEFSQGGFDTEQKTSMYVDHNNTTIPVWVDKKNIPTYLLCKEVSDSYFIQDLISSVSIGADENYNNIAVDINYESTSDIISLGFGGLLMVFALFGMFNIIGGFFK